MHKLLTPQVSRLGRPDVPPETDAVDPSFSEGTLESLKADLIDILGKLIVQARRCTGQRIVTSNFRPTTEVSTRGNS